MFTRLDYLEHRCTHSEYFAQFVNENIVGLVEMTIGKNTILSSTDEHFNDIPLIRWDILSKLIVQHVSTINKKLGNDYVWSLSDCVCVLKEAARQIRHNF